MSGVEGRRQNAAKERSPMLGPNLNEQILAADQEGDRLWGRRNQSFDKSRDRWPSNFRAASASLDYRGPCEIRVARDLSRASGSRGDRRRYSHERED